METESICNADNLIDSRDIILRIKDLEKRLKKDGLTGADWEEAWEELWALLDVHQQACDRRRWYAGERLIHENYFEEHCAAVAEERNDRHSKIDFGGVTYFVKD